MEITKEWLEEKNACHEGQEWFENQKLSDGLEIGKALMGEDKTKNEWANWLIVRIMERKQYLAYAIFAARQVLDIFEKKYPEDNRPRLAIEAAEKCLREDSAAARAAARAAGDAARAAAVAAAVDAWDAAVDAAGAAGAAAGAAAVDAWAAARAAAVAAAVDAWDAAWAAAGDAAMVEMQVRLLDYGIKLLEAEQ